MSHSGVNSIFDESVATTTRRRALVGFGTGVTGLLAGCAGLTSSDPDEDQSYTKLDGTAVHVAEGVDLSIPAEVPTVSEPYNADLVILPDDPVYGPDRVVEWLADDRIIALIGPNSEDTWAAWLQSDAFSDPFDIGGYSDGDPDPYLLVCVAIDLNLHTYRHSWSDTPSDEELLRALDEDLVAIENRTPT